MRGLKLLTVLCLTQTAVWAQTDLLNSQYILEKTFVTPANFTQEERLRLYTNYQSIAGRDRSGTEGMLSMAANYKLSEKNLVGVNFVNTSFGHEDTFVGYANYTYNLKLTERSYLSNGFGFGFQQYRLRVGSGSGVVADPTVNGNIYSSKADFRLGSTAVINKNAFFGLSFDNIMSQYNNQNDKDVNYMPASFRRINMTLMGGYKHKLDHEFGLGYEAYYTNNFGGMSIVDGNLGLSVAELFTVGVAYRRYFRSEENINLSTGILRPYITLDLGRGNKNAFRFNYAYGTSPNKVNMIGMNTHEFGLQYSLR